jgi:transcription initiation factor TFIIIB Brf1 subunit/transcription initiation factor TFIIB
MCPRCRQSRLYPTGAFWICSACGLVITEQALHYEQDSEGLDHVEETERTIVVPSQSLEKITENRTVADRRCS